MKRALALLAGLVGSALAADGNTCNLWQTCKNNADVDPWNQLALQDCADPHDITVPKFYDGGYPPVAFPDAALKTLQSPCPFYN